MTTTDHPRVDEWLRQFDDAARSLPASRRTGLRREVHSHLTDSIPLGTDDSIALLQIMEFGDPNEILSQESHAPAGRELARRPRLRRWIVVIAILAVAGLVAALALASAQPNKPASNGPFVSAGSVVNANPQGSDRLASGQAYEEYVRAIDDLPSLPDSATWPVGIPEGLEPGESAGGVVEIGGGANVARFTWLCAWEWEYLDAEDRGHDARLVDAYAALNLWADGTWWHEVDPASAWTTTVLEPLRFNDSTGLRSAFHQDCAQAGIVVAGPFTG